VPVELSEKTAGYSVTHARLGTQGLWKHQGWQLPAYIQNLARGIMKSGKTRTEAIQIAIGTAKRWAAGGGNVHPEVRAAAAKAIAEWEAEKAAAHGGSSKTTKTSNVHARVVEMAGVFELASAPDPGDAVKKRMASQGMALPDGSFRMPNAAFVRKAMQAYGRCPPKMRAALVNLIRRRARELNIIQAPDVQNFLKSKTGGAADSTSGPAKP
jgi:hypothetical protein